MRGRGRGRARSIHHNAVGPRPHGYGYGHQPRPQEPSFQFDAATLALISDVQRLMRDGQSFTLEYYRSEAETLLQQGLTLVLEYYLEGDFGECKEGLVGRYAKPWSSLSIAEILRNHSSSFAQISGKAKRLGSTLVKLLMMPESTPQSDAETALKIMCCIREALTMFPRERPHYMAHMPTLQFSEIMDVCRAKRKEMKKLWTSCIEFVQRPESAPLRPLPSWQLPSLPEPVTFMPEDFLIGSAPPLPPSKPPEPTPSTSFFLGLQSESHSPQGLVAEPLEIDPKMALSPADLQEVQQQIIARYQSS